MTQPKGRARRPRRESLCRIGTSGYQYDHWRGVFYPRDLPRTRWFSYYASHFDTVEVNNTFYRLPEAATFERWRRETPRGFLYSLKFSRYGSHIKRLMSPENSVTRFLERSAPLGDLRAVVLVQLPPRWHVEAERLDRFLATASRELRWTVELRDARWLCPEVYEVLRKHGAALCIHDRLERHPLEITADFTYLRFHGQQYAGSYSPQALSAHARRIRGWLQDGLDVFAYFNNDWGGHAVRNAADLRRYVLGS